MYRLPVSAKFYVRTAGLVTVLPEPLQHRGSYKLSYSLSKLMLSITISSPQQCRTGLVHTSLFVPHINVGKI